MDVGVEHFAAQGNAGEFTFALNVDESGGFQLFQVVGNRGRGQSEPAADARTRRGILRGGNPLQHLEAVRVGEGFADQGELAAGKPGPTKGHLISDRTAKPLARRHNARAG